MARKCYGEDDILKLLREIEIHCNYGMDIVRSAKGSITKMCQLFVYARNTKIIYGRLILCMIS